MEVRNIGVMVADVYRLVCNENTYYSCGRWN